MKSGRQSPVHVANNILRRAFDDLSDVTPMKLQRLVYLVASDYAKLTGETLLNQGFYAWEYGAVSRPIHDKFACFGGEPITSFSRDPTGRAVRVDESLLPALRRTIDRVWAQARHQSAVDLTNALRLHGSAWREAYTRSPGSAITDAALAADSTCLIADDSTRIKLLRQQIRELEKEPVA